MEIPILCEILAILKFLVPSPGTRSVQDPDYEDYKKEILGRIAGRLRRPLTPKEVEEHLLQELRSSRDYPNDILNLTLLGSAMPRVNRDSKRQIEEHIKRLNVQEENRSLRTRSTNPDTGKQPKRASSVVTFKYPSKADKRKATSKPKEPSKKKRKMQQHEARRPGKLVPSIENDGVSDCSQVTISPGAIAYVPISNSEESLSRRRTSVPETTKRSEDSINSHTQMNLNIESRMPSTVVSEYTYAFMASELAYYKKHYKKAKEECLILENQRRQVESLGQSMEDVKRVLNQHIRRITIQEKKLEDRANLERYLSFSNAPNAASSSQRLVALFHNLKHAIDTVLVMDGAEEFPIGNLPGISADLDDLLASVFGIDILCKLQGTSNNFPNFTSFELIQALTGASIYTWVFGAEFQAHMTHTTPLLEEYRSLIATWCGHESLCDLDLAAHRSIIESEGFKEVIIPKMSNIFRNRLTRALQPFFHRSLKRKATKKLRSSLRTVFRLAVEVRAESLLSANHFELIWPVAGSAANETQMEAINSNPVVDAKAVKLPLLPGLRACFKKKTMVEYGGFARGAMAEVRQDYVVKALIRH